MSKKSLGWYKTRPPITKNPYFGKKEDTASCSAWFTKLNLAHNTVFDHEIDHKGLWRYIFEWFSMKPTLHLHTESWFESQENKNNGKQLSAQKRCKLVPEQKMNSHIA